MGDLSPLDRFEIPLPREPGEGHEVFRAVFFGQSAGLGVFLAKAREGRGPPGF